MTVKTILVTGAAGFIGSNFIHYLLKGNRVEKIVCLDALTYAGNLENLRGVLDDPRLNFVRGDINNFELVELLFRQHNIDVVVNFAAESHVDRSITGPRPFYETNVLGTQTLLQVACNNWYVGGRWVEGKKFLQVSTDEVYGSLGPEGFFTEETPLDPHSPYSSSKAAADLMVKAYHDTYGLPVNITRCSNNYGPYQFPEKLIPLMIKNALELKPLPVYGDGRNVRDWLHVEDHCSAIWLVLNEGEIGEVYNIGGHNERQNIEVVKTIISTIKELLFAEQFDGIKVNPNHISEDLIAFVEDRLGHDRRYAIDPTKISKLGWSPRVAFEEGIRSTIRWYLENYGWMQRVLSGQYRNAYAEYMLKRSW